MKSSLKATITTAVPLTASQLATVHSNIEKKHKETTIELKQVVDPEIIGGVKLTVGSEEVDETIYSKLEKLHAQLKNSI